MQHIGFGLWNWIAVIVYLVAMLLVGAYFTKRASQDTDSFFKASGRLPSWAIGFSIYATTLSAITFMSTPEKAFLTDWAYIAGNIAIVAIIPISRYFMYFIYIFRWIRRSRLERFYPRCHFTWWSTAYHYHRCF